MADNQQQGNETKGCGMFGFLKKKEEEKPEDAAMIKVETNYETKDDQKPTPVDKLHRSHSNSSSSSEEEVEGEDGQKIKRKKKKGLKEKIQEKISDEREENALKKHEEMVNAEATYPEEKKGFLEKIKEKLPGQHNKAEEDAAAEGGEKEKKGILEKIKEKLPGQHSEDEKAKHKEN